MDFIPILTDVGPSSIQEESKLSRGPIEHNFEWCQDVGSGWLLLLQWQWQTWGWNHLDVLLNPATAGFNAQPGGI